jgi:hypothetical protein
MVEVCTNTPTIQYFNVMMIVHVCIYKFQHQHAEVILKDMS